jgi:hypothetical protein
MEHEWKLFLSGYWTRERPTKPGLYVVEGVGGGEPRGVSLSKTIFAYMNDGAVKFTQPWGGWWWSEPVPNLPATPDTQPEK